MLNFMYQLHWATGCLDIWLSNILGMCVRGFLCENNIETVNWVKQSALTQCVWTSCDPPKA